MIERDEVLPLLVEAVPSFEPIWQGGVEHGNLDDDGERLGYVDASAVAWHLVALLENGQIDEVIAAMQVVERLHNEGDDYVRQLATVGYLEDIQNAAMRSEVVGQQDFVATLGREPPLVARPQRPLVRSSRAVSGHWTTPRSTSSCR